MSVVAQTWVFRYAPIPRPGLFAVLSLLADDADSSGKGSFPTQEVLAAGARKTERQVRNDLQALEDAGLIKRGDQRLVSHIPVDKRPVVWDLQLHLIDPALSQFWADRSEWRRRRQEEARRLSTGGKSTSGGGGKSTSGGGGKSTSGGGGNSTSPIPSLEAKETPTAVRLLPTDAHVSELRRSAEDFVSGLPNAGRISAQRRAWITGLVAEAMARGWTPGPLRVSLLEGIETARDRWAVMGSRLANLGQAEQLPPATPATVLCPLCSHGEAPEGGVCERCRDNVRGARSRKGPSRRVADVSPSGGVMPPETPPTKL